MSGSACVDLETDSGNVQRDAARTVRRPPTDRVAWLRRGRVHGKLRFPVRALRRRLRRYQIRPDQLWRLRPSSAARPRSRWRRVPAEAAISVATPASRTAAALAWTRVEPTKLRRLRHCPAAPRQASLARTMRQPLSFGNGVVRVDLCRHLRPTLTNCGACGAACPVPTNALERSARPGTALSHTTSVSQRTALEIIVRTDIDPNKLWRLRQGVPGSRPTAPRPARADNAARDVARGSPRAAVNASTRAVIRRTAADAAKRAQRRPKRDGVVHLLESVLSRARTAFLRAEGTAST